MKMELTRKQVIETLSDIDKAYRSFTPKEISSLDYAISSLKTDEAYQIMYEGGEIFTKDEVVAMLEDLDLEIQELPIDGDNSHERTGERAMEMACRMVLQEKINALRGTDNE